MKKYAVVCTMVIGSVFGANAIAGHDQGGGGGGCVADFMRSAYETAQWLAKNGNSLSPSVSSDSFLVAIDPNIIKTTSEDLRYKGNPVDAYYDGNTITVNCDRLKSDTPEQQQRVVAHEVFRKMRLEGDAYEISRQIFPDKSAAKLTYLDLNGTNYMPLYHVCGFHFEVNDDTLYVTSIVNEALLPSYLSPKYASCSDYKECDGSTVALQCVDTTCAGDGITLTLLSDGNLMVETPRAGMFKSVKSPRSNFYWCQ